MTKKVNARGFTLLEILLVVGIISILAGIVILAINPTKQLGDTRNAQRRSDVLTIINAIYQYTLDEGNNLSDLGIASTTSPTCATDGDDAGNLEADLVTTGNYLTDIPSDPIDTDESTTTREYFVVQDSDTDRITVCAPNSIGEGSIVEATMISVTR